MTHLHGWDPARRACCRPSAAWPPSKTTVVATVAQRSNSSAGSVRPPMNGERAGPNLLAMIVFEKVRLVPASGPTGRALSA
jgi:hypothetical protein